MNKSFVISGSGGQGILSIGAILANIFILEDLFVTYCSSYGAEMRGGAVNCQVNASNKEIYSIQNKYVDYVVALNQESFDRFILKVKDNGTIIINSTLVKMEKTRRELKVIILSLKNANSFFTNAIILVYMINFFSTCTLICFY